MTVRAGTLSVLVGCLASCVVRSEAGDDVASSGEELSVYRDDMNGLWTTSDGATAMISAWPAIGVRLDMDGDSSLVTSYRSYANGPGAADDVVMIGSTRFERDVAPKPPITLALPGDRPYRAFLTDLLAPAAQRDRESYVAFHASTVRSFIHGCDPFTNGWWQYKYMSSSSIETLIDALDGTSTSPREMIHAPAFAAAVSSPYALAELGLYFSTAAGRSVHIPLASDAMIYFVTDRPDRAEKLGLSLTKTSQHGIRAASFGDQLRALGALPATDDAVYVRAMMDLLARSDTSRLASLSPAGRSALADWYGTMAIEDYRVTAFGRASLKWGSHFTNAQFYGLIVRALGNQVLVGKQLRPGGPSYADVLNAGKDMQEYPDMTALKELATSWLLETQPSAVNAVLDAVGGDPSGQYDLFRFVCDQLYDGADGKLANAEAAVLAVGTLFELLRTESKSFEGYLLARGFTKSAVRAPGVS